MEIQTGKFVGADVGVSERVFLNAQMWHAGHGYLVIGSIHELEEGTVLAPNNEGHPLAEARWMVMSRVTAEEYREHIRDVWQYEMIYVPSRFYYRIRALD